MTTIGGTFVFFSPADYSPHGKSRQFNCWESAETMSANFGNNIVSCSNPLNCWVSGKWPSVPGLRLWASKVRPTLPVRRIVEVVTACNVAQQRVDQVLQELANLPKLVKADQADAEPGGRRRA